MEVEAQDISKNRCAKIQKNLRPSIYLWFGLTFISKSWINLDSVWALSLILVGAFGVYAAYGGHH